jgi:hypothetical protein
MLCFSIQLSDSSKSFKGVLRGVVYYRVKGSLLDKKVKSAKDNDEGQKLINEEGHCPTLHEHKNYSIQCDSQAIEYITDHNMFSPLLLRNCFGYYARNDLYLNGFCSVVYEKSS